MSVVTGTERPAAEESMVAIACEPFTSPVFLQATMSAIAEQTLARFPVGRIRDGMHRAHCFEEFTRR
jgi:hypothetical protein